MKSIKDYIIRVTKKGKTKGRPSKREIQLSAFTSWLIANVGVIKGEK